MSELTCLPYGVGHAEEGICLKIQIGPYRVLLDCGLVSIAPLKEETVNPPIDFVFCTHAHPDHGRSLLELHQNWPEVPIYCSEATADLLPLNWPHIAMPNGVEFCQRLPWRHSVELAKGLTAKLWPAGHLPGAACVLITYTESEKHSRSVFYTGDFFLSNSRLVEGLPLDEVRGLKPDVLIVEGSQGTARYPHRRQQENRLADQINQAIASGYNVLMPVPLVGLGQELLMLLRSHHHFTGRELNVWVDAWIAEACDIYLELLPHLPSSVQNFARHQPLFWDERILPRIKRLPRLLPDTPDHPTILLGYQDADLSDLVKWGDVPWRIFLPEDLATNVVTAGLEQEDTHPQPTLDWLQRLGEEFEMGSAYLDTYLLTAHSDVAGTTQLIHNLRPHHVIFVHGAPAFLADLAGLEDLQSRYKLHLPPANQLVELPIGDTFLQPVAPDTVFEGEIADTEMGITIALPPDIQEDPRWNRLADTGVIQIRWQGNDLIIRGISQQTLLRQTTPPAVLNSAIQCCFNCVHWQQPRCNNSNSPMYGFPVAAEGYCPEFTAKSDS